MSNYFTCLVPLFYILIHFFPFLIFGQDKEDLSYSACFCYYQAALNHWEWNQAISRTTRSRLPASSGPSTWTCSLGSLERPGWISRAKSTLGRPDTVTSHSGYRYDTIGAKSVTWRRYCRDKMGISWKMNRQPVSHRLLVFILLKD